MNYSDIQLKQALAKILPETLIMVDLLMYPTIPQLQWRDKKGYPDRPVRDTELLHLCWLVEDTLTLKQRACCAESIYTQVKGTCVYHAPHPDYHATWQQRVVALCKVKGVEI